jgi:hypothetical protein
LQIGEMCEPKSLVGWVSAWRRDAHQATQAQPGKLKNFASEIGKSFRSHTGFAVFLSQGDLYADIQVRLPGPAMATQFLRHFQATYAVDPVEAGSDFGGLVALYVANKVPLDIEIRQLRLFAQRFLQKIFAKSGLTRLEGCANGGGGMLLADRQQIDIRGVTTTTYAGLLDSVADFQQILCDVVHVLLKLGSLY